MDIHKSTEDRAERRRRKRTKNEQRRRRRKKKKTKKEKKTEDGRNQEQMFWICLTCAAVAWKKQLVPPGLVLYMHYLHRQVYRYSANISLGGRRRRRRKAGYIGTRDKATNNWAGVLVLDECGVVKTLFYVQLSSSSTAFKKHRFRMPWNAGRQTAKTQQQKKQEQDSTHTRYTHMYTSTTNARARTSLYNQGSA